MKGKQIRFIFCCLVVGLIAILSIVMTACSSTSKSAPKSITAPTLSSITVAPASPANLAVGSTQQFTATGNYSDGTTSNITIQVTWASSDLTIATIDNGVPFYRSGVATGVAPGNTKITASMSGVTSSSISLTVVPR